MLPPFEAVSPIGPLPALHLSAELVVAAADRRRFAESVDNIAEMSAIHRNDEARLAQQERQR
jgi:hypothetical protein